MASRRIMNSSKLCILFIFFFLQNLAIFEALIVEEPQFPCLFFFGDSFVDNGNNRFLNGLNTVYNLPYGIDFPAGPTGRSSNGRNVADFIANKLGFEHPIPPFANGTTQHILQGLNYGSGGSGILNETAAQFGVLSLSDQLLNHERVTIPRFKRVLGGNLRLRSCLYYAGFGTNDIKSYFRRFYSNSTNFTPNQFASFVISKYSNQLRRLYNDGARKVAVVGVGDLGCTPVITSAYGSPVNSSSCVETANDIVRIFNRDLKLLVSTLNRDFPLARFVYTKDTALTLSTDGILGGVEFLVDQGLQGLCVDYISVKILLKPARALSLIIECSSSSLIQGSIEIQSKACCLVKGGLCIPRSVPCSNRGKYRFWDQIHPTEVVAAAAAITAYNDISVLFAAR